MIYCNRRVYNKDDRRRIPLNHKIIDNHVLVLVLDCLTTDCHGIRLTLSNTTGACTETGSAYLSDTPAITPIFFLWCSICPIFSYRCSVLLHRCLKALKNLSDFEPVSETKFKRDYPLFFNKKIQEVYVFEL